MNAMGWGLWDRDEKPIALGVHFVEKNGQLVLTLQADKEPVKIGLTYDQACLLAEELNKKLWNGAYICMFPGEQP